MRIWTVSNQKGGVGKTTTAVALGGLAVDKGMRVLLLDLDPHGSMTSYFGFNADTRLASSFNLFENPKRLNATLVSELIEPTSLWGLDMIPASTALATLERQAIGKDGMGLVVMKALQLVASDYDLAIIDTPPLLGVLMVNALAACQQLLVPVQTEHLAVKGLERMVHTLTMLGKSRKSPLSYTIVPTLFDRRTQASVMSLRHIRNQYPDHAWAGMIPVDTKLRDASKAGIVPHSFDSESRAVAAYKSLLKLMFEKTKR
ncbi:ParA family protein [Marinibactrum halimedae]|uniref:Cobyrinic acid a,c-diamide synthase n=1 Tax=Marinibactrum halimedae TaxID=1444977 RepID=A0AA37TAS9_9GAMM|nr:ParA family protein [Marinibactrum halimedae]MCD9459811.1 ParA family protein [Marinibactrum halimedae]GLS26996.1 cobyrinic acid a,c-diamide synthase [Marinibactrum halimedae]